MTTNLIEKLYNALEARYPDIVQRHGHELIGTIILDVVKSNKSENVSDMVKEVIRKIETRVLEQTSNNINQIDFSTALDKARKITKQFKNNDSYIDIITQIQMLANSVGIEENEFKFLINDVYEKHSQLGASIVNLEEPFKEKVDQEQYKNIDEKADVFKIKNLSHMKNQETPKRESAIMKGIVDELNKNIGVKNVGR